MPTSFAAPLLVGMGGPQASPLTNQAVQVFGSPSSYAFGEAFHDAYTPTGHTFHAFPADWSMPFGTGPWFGVGLQDGVTVALSSMDFKGDELYPTMYQTSLFTWNTETNQLQVIPIPTTTGVYNPPHSSGASGNAIDNGQVVTLDGVNYVFFVAPITYQGWEINGPSGFGEPYVIMALQETDGVWSFDPTHSYTASHLAASVPSWWTSGPTPGAQAFVSAMNSSMETYHVNPGFVGVGLAPISGHLIMGAYYYISPAYSGCLIAVDPATGTVTAFYQVPDITDVNSVALTYSIRDLSVNPITSSGDERFVITPDVYVRGGSGYAYHPLSEFSYNGSSAFQVKSPPITPFSMADIGYTTSYNLTAYDPDGNLYCPTHGGSGTYGVFDSQELHFFKASGNTLPTMEVGLSGDGFNGTFPTVTSADFRFGSFADNSAHDQSINYDNARSRMMVLGENGTIYAAAVTNPSNPAFGSELSTNGSLSTGTSTGWSGLFNTSHLTVVTDSDFITSSNPSGYCLELSSVDGTANAASNATISVTQFQNYSATIQVKGVTTPEAVTAEFWWGNGTTTLFSLSPVVTMTSIDIAEIVLLDNAPEGAITGFYVISIAGGANYKVGNLSWKAEPAIAVPELNTNSNRLTSGAEVSLNKGAIVGSHFYFSTLHSAPSNYPANIGQLLSQWMTRVDLTAL